MISVPEKNEGNPIRPSWRWFDAMLLIAFGVFVFLAVRYQLKLLDYMDWGDEAETIVGAKMIAAGLTLYSQIFNQHGPLTFLPGLIVEKIGNFGVSGHRVAIAILQIVAMLSLYFSPLLNGNLTKRLYTMAAVTVILLYLPEIFGHTYIYQVLVGLVLVIILAQYTLPSIASASHLSARRVVVGNILIASLPFLAITYLPISLILFVASLRKEFLKKSVVAFIGGGIGNIAFLALIGSIPGYLAFHIYLNARVLPLFYDGLGVDQLLLTAFHNTTDDLPQFTILLITVAATSVLANREKGLPWRSILLGGGLASLLIRGPGFHALPYFYAWLAIPLVFFYSRPFPTRQAQLIVLAFALICIVKVSLMVPREARKLASQPLNKSTEFAKLAEFFTQKSDRIVAYSFQNNEYIAADRLPVSGHFFYLPWQEKYNENPKFGIKINACKEITEYRPKVMLIDKKNVWDRFPWATYASCIQKFIDTDYVQWPERPFYIRKDLVTQEMGINFSGGPSRKKLASSQLGAGSPIPVLMTPEHQAQNGALKRIGVMFGTYERRNSGEAELRLTGPDGAQFSKRFSLSDLADNRYRYFDLDAKRYTGGEIAAISGGGVSTWNSIGENGSALTCIIYEYVDGKFRFTPSCPLYTWQ